MSCEISVIYPGLDGEERILEIPETRRSYGVINFGSDPTVCFGDAPGMGGVVLDRWEAEEYGILPRHCALLWAGGKFRLEFDRHAGVYLNGSETCARSFCNPFEDGAEFEMRLGLPNTDRHGADLGIAPVFRVRRKDVERRKTDFLNEWAMQSIWIARALKLPFLISLPWLVVAVAVLFLASFVWDGLQSRRITQALIRADIPEQVGEQFVPSVASIGVMRGERFVPYGTAWLYEHETETGASSKWLVTNLHVVQQMQIGGCSGPAGTRPAVARFPASADGAIASETLALTACPRTHPLYAAFESFRYPLESQAGALVSAGEDDLPANNGQQAVANLYDLAAFEIDANALNQDRQFLSLGSPSQADLSPFDITPRFTQTVHSCPQFGLGLAELVCDLSLALLQIGDRLVAGFFSLVQRLRHLIQLTDFGLGHAGEAIDQPTGKPAQHESYKEDHSRRNDEFGSVHGAGLFAFCRSVICWCRGFFLGLFIVGFCCQLVQR